MLAAESCVASSHSALPVRPHCQRVNWTPLVRVLTVLASVGAEVPHQVVALALLQQLLLVLLCLALQQQQQVLLHQQLSPRLGS
jgi:hypothetical protein